MTNIKEKMNAKDIKTILFAGLIMTLAIPMTAGGGIINAYAQEGESEQEKIEIKGTWDPDSPTVQPPEDEEEIEFIEDNKPQKKIKMTDSNDDKNQASLESDGENTNFSARGSQAGCSALDTFTVNGYIPSTPIDWFKGSHDYPDEISTGFFPWCTNHSWESLSVTEINLAQDWVCSNTFTSQPHANNNVKYNCFGGFVEDFDAVQLEFSGNYENTNSLFLTDTIVVGT